MSAGVGGVQGGQVGYIPPKTAHALMGSITKFADAKQGKAEKEQDVAIKKGLQGGSEIAFAKIHDAKELKAAVRAFTKELREGGGVTKETAKKLLVALTKNPEALKDKDVANLKRQIETFLKGDSEKLTFTNPKTGTASLADKESKVYRENQQKIKDMFKDINPKSLFDTTK